MGSFSVDEERGAVEGQVHGVFGPSEVGRWEEVRGRLNRVLEGWSNYFSYGTRRRITACASECEDFCGGGGRCRRAATGRSVIQVVFGKLGACCACAGGTWVRRLRQLEGGSRPESRMREIRTSGSMSGDGKRDQYA